MLLVVGWSQAFMDGRYFIPPTFLGVLAAIETKCIRQYNAIDSQIIQASFLFNRTSHCTSSHLSLISSVLHEFFLESTPISN